MKYTAKSNTKGIWIQLMPRINAAFREIFAMSPVHKEVYTKARVDLPRYKKDGSVSKIPMVMFRCSGCKNLFNRKDCNVDHIKPVMPIGESIQTISIIKLFNRTFCDVDNLQVLCKECHKIKSKSENQERRV